MRTSNMEDRVAGQSDQQQPSELLLERFADMARRLAETDTLDELLQLVVDMGESYLERCDGVSLMMVGRGGRSPPAPTPPPPPPTATAPSTTPAKARA